MKVSGVERVPVDLQQEYLWLVVESCLVVEGDTDSRDDAGSGLSRPGEGQEAELKSESEAQTRLASAGKGKPTTGDGRKGVALQERVRGQATPVVRRGEERTVAENVPPKLLEK